MNLGRLTRLAGATLRSIAMHPSRLLPWGRRALWILRADGPSGLRRFIASRYGEGRVMYQEWIRRYDTLKGDDRQQIARRIERFVDPPTFDILMPVLDSPASSLRSAIDSVLSQLYPHWTLCIADDASTAPHVARILAEYATRDPRVRVVTRTSHGNIAEASNSALAIATGDYLALLDHDDELAPHALYMMAEAINADPDTELLYSDEDGLDELGERVNPQFKPDWSPDLLRSCNYVGHLTVLRRSTVERLGGFRHAFVGSQDYDLVLRIYEDVGRERVQHVPHVLYHWRSVAGSVKRGGAAKSYAHENARSAIRAHLARLGVSAEVQRGYREFHRVIYALPEPAPLVSIIIGTRDNARMLHVVVEGILHRTDYSPIEVVIADNQSVESETRKLFAELSNDERVRVISHDAKFNHSAINNAGVAASSGEIILLLNNDIEVHNKGWLRELASHACRPEVGVVGSKLLFEDGRIQHAGITLGIRGSAGNAFRGYPLSDPGYANRAMLIGNYSAVTGACMAMRRSVYEEIGGLDEKDFGVAFNDVDLCLRARRAGYDVVWTPYAQLTHFESASRGSDVAGARRERFERERDALRKRWGSELERDPYYNPNLSLEREDFALGRPPRASKPWRDA